MKKIVKIGFCAGEVSGDLHGAFLFKRLKQQFPEIKFEGFGLGGPLMELSGIDILHDLTHRSSVGIIESLPYVFDRYKIGKKLIKQIEKRKPDIFIFIDNQGFNIPLSAAIKKTKVKTIYYFPPPISIWGKWNGKKLQKSIDYFFIPFKDDFLEYNKINNTNSFFYGHPFMDEIYLQERLNELPDNNDIDIILNIFRQRDININQNNTFLKSLEEKNDTISENTSKPNYIDYKKYLRKTFINKANILKYIYLMPGSRKQEIKNLLPEFIKVAKTIFEKYNIISIIPVSNDKFKHEITSLVNNKKYIFLINKNYYWIYKNSLFSIMASGTATLEGLVLNVPMLICYKISKLTFFLGKLFVNSQWVGMANIIGKTEVAKEFLQKTMNYDEILKETIKLIENNQYYLNKKEKMLNVVNKLKKDYKNNSITLYAKKIMELI